MTVRSEMEAVLEAVLHVAGEPVSRERLLGLFEADERAEAELALGAVLARYAPEEHRGVVAEEVGGGFRLVTRPELGGWLRRFFDVKASGKLSMAALETLAIVAYRQPITSPEIQELRNVNPAGVLKTLLERRMVRVAGRKQVVGSPLLYRTTKEFLLHFGLDSLKDLPPLEEFEESLGLAASGDGGAAAEAPSGAGELPDREEQVLREAALLDEREEDRAAALEADAEEGSR
jgi:segregation and condensation protein B